MSTHYEVLGLTPEASVAEIKTAIRRGQRAHHPDVAGDSPEHHDAYLAIMEASEVLLDERKRANYDASLAASPSSGPPPPRSDHGSRSWSSSSGSSSGSTSSTSGTSASGASGGSSSASSFTSGTAAPRPAGPKRNTAPDGDVIVTDLGPDPRVLAGLVTGLALLDALVCQVSFVAAFMLFAIISLVVMVAGYADYQPSGSSKQRPRPRRRRRRVVIATRTATIVGAVLGGLGVIIDLWLWSEHSSQIRTAVSVFAVMPALGVLSWWLGQLFWWRRRDQKILKPQALQDSWWFGRQSGGLDGARMTKLLEPIVGRNVRVFMISHPVYTHVVLADRQVTFLRHLEGPNGRYSFSGTTLIVEMADGSLHEVAKVDLEATNVALLNLIPRGVSMAAYLVMSAEHVDGPSTIASVSDLPIIVNSDSLNLNRSAAVDALVAVASVAP